MAYWSLDGATIVAGGRRLTGFGESDAISYKRVKDDFEPIDCCDGASIHNHILCTRGEVTITLRYDSTSLRALADLADAAESFSFTCSFANGRVVESGETYVLKRPEPSYGARSGDEIWVLSCVPLEITYEQGGTT